MPPRPPAPWADIREVPKQAIIAPQLDPAAKAAEPGSRRAAVSGIGSEAGSIESEDCLMSRCIHRVRTACVDR